MIDRILEDREKRYNKIQEMLEHGLPVLCGKINYPGNDKNTAESKRAFYALLKTLELNFKNNSLETIYTEGYDGRGIVMLLNMDLITAKKIAVKIEEEHPLGRIFDIDLYHDSGEPINRGDVGCPPRGCIICGQNPRECAKIKRHDLKEVINKINEIINSYGED